MSETSRDVVLNLKLKQQPSTLKPPDTKSANKAVADYEKSVTSASKAIVEENQRIKDSVADITEEQEKAKAEADNAARTIADAQLRTAEGFKAGADGAFTFARGLALVGVSGEEDMAKVTAAIANIQGKFDLFRGGVDGMKGFVEGTRALKEATGAATIVEAAHTTAITIKTKALAASRAAIVAVKAALGPVGIAMAGVTAVLAAAAAAWTFFKSKAEEAAEVNLDGLKRQSELIKASTAALLANSEAQSQAGQRLDAVNSKRLAMLSVEDRLLAIQRKKALLGDDFTGDSHADGSFATGSSIAREQARLAKAKAKKVKNPLTTGRSKVLEANKLAAEFELQNQIQIVDEQKRSLEIIQQRQAILEQEKSAKSAILDKEKASLETRKAQLETAKSLVTQEKNRLRSLDEQVGRLDAASRIELKTLIERAKGGNISFDEVQRLEQLGGERVKGFTKDFFVKSGQSAGGASIFDGLPGGDAPARGPQSKLAQLEGSRDKLVGGLLGKLGASGAALETGKINAQLAILEEKRKQSNDESSRLLEKLIEIEDGATRRAVFQQKLLGNQQKRLQQLEQDLEKLNAAEAS